MGQVVLSLALDKTSFGVCSTRDTLMRSSVLKRSHGVLVPVLLNLELIVVFTWGSELGGSFSIILGRVGVSHLLIVPCVFSIGVNHMVFRVMFLNKSSFRGVISTIRTLSMVKFMLSLLSVNFSLFDNLFLELFSELGKLFLLENFIVFVLILVKFVALHALVGLFHPVFLIHESVVAFSPWVSQTVLGSNTLAPFVNLRSFWLFVVFTIFLLSDSVARGSIGRVLILINCVRVLSILPGVSALIGSERVSVKTFLEESVLPSVWLST